MSTPTRTYRGRAVEELIPRIQAELGPEAIILRRREGLTGGILGFFQHPYVELEAMPGGPSVDVYDEPPAGGEPTYEPPPPPPPMAPQPLAPPAPPPPAGPPPGAYQAPPPAYQPQPPAPPAPPIAPVSPPPFYAREPLNPDYGSAYVTARLAALARTERRAPPSIPRRTPPPAVDFRELVARELSPPPPAPRRPAPEYVSAPAPIPAPPPERRTVVPGSHVRAAAGVQRNLCRLGISEELALELIEAARAHTLALAPRAGLAQAVRITLSQRIPVASPLPAKGAAIVLIGAGGSGKTSCCAALLGAYRTSSTLPASFATLTRVPPGSELQLILSPQIVKPAPAGAPRAQRALRRARTEGLAVIDTPRVSPADRLGIRELARLLGELEPERIVVALPATLGAAAAAQLLEALEPLGANALALTHADETDQIGVAVEAACRFGLAPEYVLDRGRGGGGWRLGRTDPTELAAKLLR